jgi:hypothetical protein
MVRSCFDASNASSYIPPSISDSEAWSMIRGAEEELLRALRAQSRTEIVVGVEIEIAQVKVENRLAFQQKCK